MRSKNKSLTKMIGLLLALAMTVCMIAGAALQTSAAVFDGAAGGDSAKPLFNAYIDTGTMILIVLIVILIMVVIGGVVVVIVLMNKKKNNDQAVVPGPNMMPSPAPTNSQSFNHVQPMPSSAPPVNQTPPQPAGGFNNIPPVAPAEQPFPPQGAGDTTVLGVSSTGFILLRKNGGEKVCINKPEFYIGKEKAKVDYCITNNNSISRRHARIKVRAGKCYISDLGSTNCTYINGTKLSPNQEIALIPGDKIKFSNEEFEYLG